MELEHVATTLLPLARGLFDVSVYRSGNHHQETVVISQGEVRGQQGLFVRIHSECFTGEVLGSQRCDCQFQLHYALEQITLRGKGMVIYLRQEGRGIGLGNKIKAYELQRYGLDTVEANHALGFPTDLRSFALAAKILLHLNIVEVVLNSNNAAKCAALSEAGITVQAMVPSLAPVQEFNHRYLKTKYHKMGHLLGGLFP